MRAIMGALGLMDESRDDVLLAQIEAFKRRAPLLYFVLIVNVVALAATHYAAAPSLLSVYVPAGVTVLVAVRMVAWYRRRDAAFDLAQARKNVLLTAVLGSLIGVVLVLWSLALYPYDIERSGGYLTGHGHVVLFVGITMVSCVFLLMHVRAAALAIILIVVPLFCGRLIIIGQPIEIAVAINLVLVAAGMFHVVLAFSRDFEAMVRSRTELARLSRQNAELANVDAATGLPNRRRFFFELESIAGDSVGFAVSIGDLDGFKQINDLYGHIVGDQVLREIAARLAALAPAGACVARLGGDEFAVLLRGEDVEEAAPDVCQRLIAACAAPVVIDHLTVHVGLSVGLSIAAGDGKGPLEHYERADYALYRAKQNGRGRVELFSSEHEHLVRQTSRLEQALRRANLDREIVVMYQPMVDARSGRVISFEALARWNSPDLGAVQPDAFIPIAERSALIYALTRTVLRKALQDAAQWPQHTGLKVNLSVRDLTSSEQILGLMNIIRSSGLSPGRVTFEITESIFVDNLNLVQASIAALKALGCSIAIDDFGVGYSSLSYIHHLAPDIIKIDRCFVAGLCTDPIKAGIVKTVIELCQNVGAKSVAEGVETVEQAEVLRALGCSEFQGYYFGKPLARDKVMAFAGSGAVEVA
ncbi:EAL domain-containing protein [Bradyrhizobium sp. U87765 SZCCT0131]|uniref:putative bifunctional diguanylate cyclase/phosphodiesterase n=1 Tax=unclassified Bradyrhizobium TaxID=2631580 RepID=UPI001BAC7897|nr:MULTISPECIES: EAL domain-containing protein [unclassified Bradyrhizobium]MBR1218852.1 EAL domain-containing protein [Bradyrhizobium sp. U87765 SZCCT0131]MBR1261503.1 EAL domain-containing protein [Bradyrhizobium sp. U87765 SZCCT0134]MBR1306644.1 EAL domain-containing protein [Bradyrhizobium sp. U87765 SZCCT0110]MBR1317285.1 EAL domain-containing protein [Bradyrhizobium sp. U87765 SZCCT0109]MBR1350987.1 EAL domain-containing protein [Bradyrhizobium sp. U87765 SZCCT0048]